MRGNSARRLRLNEVLGALIEPRTAAEVHVVLGGKKRVSLCTVRRTLDVAENGTWAVRRREGGVDVWALTEYGEQRLRLRQRTG